MQQVCEVDGKRIGLPVTLVDGPGILDLGGLQCLVEIFKTGCDSLLLFFGDRGIGLCFLGFEVLVQLLPIDLYQHGALRVRFLQQLHALDVGKLLLDLLRRRREQCVGQIGGEQRGFAFFPLILQLEVKREMFCRLVQVERNGKFLGIAVFVRKVQRDYPFDAHLIGTRAVHIEIQIQLGRRAKEHQGFVYDPRVCGDRCSNGLPIGSHAVRCFCGKGCPARKTGAENCGACGRADFLP